MRIDVLLVKLGIAESRQKAQLYIKNKAVYANGKLILKPSCNVNEDDKIEYRGSKEKYVSRGGLKLEYAIQKFNIDCNGKIAMDIGASTGGFTDCLLQNNIAKVYSIDVGTDQLNSLLKNNSKVISMEKTDIRNLAESIIAEKMDLIVADVSFISIKKIIPSAILFLKPQGTMIFLIKPQFEVGRENIGKKGIVKDKSVHMALLKDMIEYFYSLNLNIVGLDVSPIKGGEGNIEYLACLNIAENPNKVVFDIKNIVMNAFNNDR